LEETCSPQPLEAESRLMTQLENFLQFNIEMTERLIALELANTQLVEEHPTPMDNSNPLLEEVKTMRQDKSGLLQIIQDWEKAHNSLLEEHHTLRDNYNPLVEEVETLRQDNSRLLRNIDELEEALKYYEVEHTTSIDDSMRQENSRLLQNVHDLEKEKVDILENHAKSNQSSSFSPPSSHAHYPSYHSSSIKVRSVWVQKEELQHWRDSHPVHSYSSPQTPVRNSYYVFPPISNAPSILGKPPSTLKRLVPDHSIKTNWVTNADIGTIDMFFIDSLYQNIIEDLEDETIEDTKEDSDEEFFDKLLIFDTSTFIPVDREQQKFDNLALQLRICELEKAHTFMEGRISQLEAENMLLRLDPHVIIPPTTLPVSPPQVKSRRKRKKVPSLPPKPLTDKPLKFKTTWVRKEDLHLWKEEKRVNSLPPKPLADKPLKFKPTWVKKEDLWKEGKRVNSIPQQSFVARPLKFNPTWVKIEELPLWKEVHHVLPSKPVKIGSSSYTTQDKLKCVRPPEFTIYLG
jgi:hypothetical protein